MPILGDEHTAQYSCRTHIEQGRLVRYVLVGDTLLSVRVQLLGHRQEVVERRQVGEITWGMRNTGAGTALFSFG